MNPITAAITIVALGVILLVQPWRVCGVTPINENTTHSAEASNIDEDDDIIMIN